MITNKLCLIFIATFTNSLLDWNCIQATEYSDADIFEGLGDLVQLEDSFSNISSWNKRPRTEASSLERSKKKAMKYHNYTTPIDPIIDRNMRGFLKGKERELASKGNTREFKWQNHNALTLDEGNVLCINVWRKLKLPLEIRLTDEMIPDCEGSLVLGPSITLKTHIKKYTGFYKYLPELKKVPFFPDLLRCNCAHREWKEKSFQYRTVGNSEKFFFLLKDTEQGYYVLTLDNNWKKKEVKIVNFISVSVS